MQDEKIDKNNLIMSVSIVVSAVIMSGALVYSRSNAVVSAVEDSDNRVIVSDTLNKTSFSEEDVLPSAGVILPAVWGDIGTKLVKEGVIDVSKLERIYVNRGGLGEEERKMLFGSGSNRIKITKDNAQYLLNMFWALGLANKNSILEDGEMMSSGDAGNFASTGGWTISGGNPIEHYSRHEFLNLSSAEQALVDRVSRNIYRPCCGNSTHFPDCNHGMAMLGFLELMASQGVGEKEMYRAALAVNSYWFPDNYLTMAEYMQNRGVSWDNVSPKDILGAKYSSGSGFADIKSQIANSKKRSVGGGGCSV